MPRLSQQQEAFLREAHLAVVTTLRADGSPQSTVVWVDGADGELLFNTARGRAKERHLLADPRISVTVVDGSDFHRWLTVEGRAVLVDEGAADHIDALAVRYMGPRARRISGSGEQRVIVRVPPTGPRTRVSTGEPNIQLDQKLDMIVRRLRRQLGSATA